MPSAAWLVLGQHVVLALTVVAVPVLDAQWLPACLKASLSDGPGLVDREELGQELEERLDRLRYIGQGIGPGTSAERISEIYADLHGRSRLARPRRVLGSPDIGQC